MLSKDLTIAMIGKNPFEVAEHIVHFNKYEGIRVGVVGKDGLPAFNSNIKVPEEVFAAQKELRVLSENELVFFRPLPNEPGCYGCHNPKDKTLGMIVFKTSVKKAKAEIASMAKRLIAFSLIIGLISEIFLILVARKMILNPLDILHQGAYVLKSGRLDYRIKMERGDEIGALAACFNEMAESIEKSHENLEKAVEQKSKELKAIAEISSETFKGPFAMKEVLESFLRTITDKMEYEYSAICLLDKETGLFLQEFTNGINAGLCKLNISLSGNHPLAEAVRETISSIRKALDIDIREKAGNAAIIPIISHQRKRCKEVNSCFYENCPAFNSADERCWLIDDTLCRSPHAIAGIEKIYNCIRCNVFPVFGVLVAGRDEEITATSLNSLEILASEIASAIENQRLIESKKEDLSSVLKLHGISVETIQNLNIQALTKSIVSSVTVFADMDAAILWLRGDDKMLHFENATDYLNEDIIPKSIPEEESFVGRAITEEQIIETIKIKEAECLSAVIDRYKFMYVALVPIVFKGASFGCLALFKKKDFFMTDSEKAIIQLFASQSASAINSTRIYNELKIEKEFSEAILSNMTTGIMVLDKEGRIIRSNPAAFDILKITDYIVGGKLEDIFPEASDFMKLDSATHREIEILIGNAAVPIGFVTSPFLNANNEQTGIIVVFQDLTEIKKLQNELRKKHHFETMGKIIAGVAHEIRNPLFGISSIVQILEREIKSKQHLMLLKATLGEIYRLKNLVEELLLCSRPSKLSIAEIDFKSFMEKINHHIKSKRKDASLNYAVPFPVTIKADTDKLTQVFLNLMDNALNAGSNEINVSAEETNGKITISIKDNGIGIKRENIDRIFEPFFTTRKEGTGLGLSICKKLIEDHGGGIEIQSVEGGGTTVLLTLNL